MKQIKKRMVTFLMAIVMVFAVCGTAFAASSTATHWESFGNTSAVGPGAKTTASYEFKASRKGYYTVSIKDPMLWHEWYTSDVYQSNVKSSKTITGGSKNAYWKGWVQNGKVTITV